MAPPNLPDKSTIIKPPKLLDQVRDKLRVKHYSIRTEQSYVGWIKREPQGQTTVSRPQPPLANHIPSQPASQYAERPRFF